MRVFFAFIEFQIIRTANDFSHSLLDFLESRVVKISGYEKRRLETNHWTEITEGTFNVLRTFREVDVVSAFSSSTSQDVSPNSTSQAERQNKKEQHTSLQLVCCSFFPSYLIAERAIRATV